MHFFGKGYALLRDRGDSQTAKARVTTKSTFRWLFVLQALLAVLLVAAIAVACTLRVLSLCINDRPLLSSIPVATEVKTCGNSPAEARDRGCVFDILNFAWQVPDCYDKEIVDEFRSLQNWTFYRDAAGLDPVPMDLASKGDIDMLFAPWEFHFVHCKYTWTQMHRILFADKPMDSHLASTNHTRHCGKLLVNNDYVETGNMGTQTPIIYPTCNIGESWISGGSPELLKQSGLD